MSIIRGFRLLTLLLAASTGAWAAAQTSSAIRNVPKTASQTGLPIEQGVYFADYSRSCSAATELFFYDGKSFGYLLQALPGDRMNSPRAASIEAYTILRIAAMTRTSKDYDANLAGFTRVWPTEADAFQLLGVKPAAAGRFVLREGSVSARRMEIDDTTYQKCATSQLSSRMQATLRQYRPQLAGGTFQQTAGPGATAPARPATPAIPPRIPLAVGYYAYVEGTFSTCAKPVSNPWYFDGTRFREDSDVFDPKHENTSQAVKWEMVSANRFRITYRTRDEDGRWDPHLSVNEYVITGPQSFTYVGSVGGPMNASEKHQLCSAAQLPAKARWFKGAK